MSGRQFQPGDVAMVELPLGGERAGVLVDDEGDRCWHVGSRHGAGLLCLDADAVAVRPLVLIDPEDREQVERLIRGFWANGNDDCDDVRAMTDALREFADPKPPKPAEPRGLGAVVRDSDGETWVRIYDHAGDCNDWRQTGAEGGRPEADQRRFWHEIDVTDVLSEGVTP